MLKAQSAKVIIIINILKIENGSKQHILTTDKYNCT